VVSYQYDNNGNLKQKTDSRPITITYEYDALNRNYSVNYGNTTIGSPDVPDVLRFYDGATTGKGRLWKSYAGGNETVGSNVDNTSIDEYDPVGRPKSLSQRFKLNNAWGDANHTYQVSRIYNLAGAVTSQTYASGNSVTYNYDIAGQLADKDAQNLAFTGNLGVGGAPRTYAKGILYAPAGQLKQEQFGTSSPVYNNLSYNSRQQLIEILANTNGTPTLMNLGRIVNQYDCSGVGCNGTENNGNLRKQEVHIPNNDQGSAETNWYQQYDYDYINRLKRVHEYTGNTNLDWQQEFDYDRWGNRTLNATGTWLGNSNNPPSALINETQFDTGDLQSTNRLYAPGDLVLPDNQRRMRYDGTGNLTTDTYTGAGIRTYDAENRMTQANGGNNQYTYNADGQRVRRKINGIESWQIYGFAGELLSEYPANADKNNPTKEYGYRNGQLLISAESGNGFAPPVFGDNFDDNSLNPNSWTTYYQSTPTVTEQSQQLQITLTQNQAAYNGVYYSTYDLTNRMVQLESVQSVSQAGWCENYLELELNANNYFMIQVGAGNMIFRSRVNGVNDQTSIPFDGTANRFWRIRHDQSANLIYFETSADANVWLTRKTVTPGFAITALRFDLLAGAYGTGNSSPGTAKYDNFKLLASNAGSSSLNVPNSGFESPVLGNGNWQYSPSGGSWSFANGGGITGMNSAFTGTPSAAPEGVQVAFIQSTGTVTQSISGFQANTNYIITFLAIQRTNCCNAGGQDISVYIDATLLGTFHPSGTAYVEYSTSTFTTTAGSQVVKFAGLDLPHTGVTAFFDKVRITGSPKPGFGIQWLIADQLGTPRMIFDESGLRANVKRHDYLPFGEELAANTGLRTTPQGYSTSDGVRQQFTSKERDNETGLDYFGARYFASTQGRFTTPDPLLGSGRIGSPQTWNRYNYVLNNPLKFSDPLGLFEYLPGTSGDDQKRIKKAYDQLVKARDKYKVGSKQYNAINDSLNALGAPGVKNNVLVGVDNNLKTPGETFSAQEYSNGNVSGSQSVVMLKLSSFKNDDQGNAQLAGALGHEGTHVADAQAEAGRLIGTSMAQMNSLADSGGIMSHAISEVHAYRVSAYIAAAITPSNIINSSFSGYEIWNRGWKSADEMKLRETGIGGVLQSPTGSYHYRFLPNSISLPLPTLNNALDNSRQWVVNGGPILQ
jgi:RHS repeat-associated protein